MSNLDVLTAKEAAQLLGISDRMVRYLLEAGDLEGTKITPRQWVITRESVMTYMTERDARQKKNSEENE